MEMDKNRSSKRQPNDAASQEKDKKTKDHRRRRQMIGCGEKKIKKQNKIVYTQLLQYSIFPINKQESKDGYIDVSGLYRRVGLHPSPLTPPLHYAALSIHHCLLQRLSLSLSVFNCTPLSDASLPSLSDIFLHLSLLWSCSSLSH